MSTFENNMEECTEVPEVYGPIHKACAHFVSSARAALEKRDVKKMQDLIKATSGSGLVTKLVGYPQEFKLVDGGISKKGAKYGAFEAASFNTMILSPDSCNEIPFEVYDGQQKINVTMSSNKPAGFVLSVSVTPTFSKQIVAGINNMSAKVDEWAARKGLSEDEYEKDLFALVGFEEDDVTNNMIGFAVLAVQRGGAQQVFQFPEDAFSNDEFPVDKTGILSTDGVTRRYANVPCKFWNVLLKRVATSPFVAFTRTRMIEVAAKNGAKVPELNVPGMPNMHVGGKARMPKTSKTELATPF